MKKLFIILAVMFCASTASAQKYGYIYSKKVFDVMPQYNSAVKEIDSFAKLNREIVDKKIKEVSVMYNEYQQYASQMTNADQVRYRDLIVKKEKEANDYEKSVFGASGTLEAKQKEMMSPIEKMVLDAVTKIANEGGYEMIFDLSLVKVTIFQSEKCDLTDKVIKLLGY
ncbi:MAG: OmpH family outer membrane protein [Rikenellaceae bacterium]